MNFPLVASLGNEYEMVLFIIDATSLTRNSVQWREFTILLSNPKETRERNVNRVRYRSPNHLYWRIKTVTMTAASRDDGFDNPASVTIQHCV